MLMGHTYCGFHRFLEDGPEELAAMSLTNKVVLWLQPALAKLCDEETSVSSHCCVPFSSVPLMAMHFKQVFPVWVGNKNQCMSWNGGCSLFSWGITARFGTRNRGGNFVAYTWTYCQKFRPDNLWEILWGHSYIRQGDVFPIYVIWISLPLHTFIPFVVEIALMI